MSETYSVDEKGVPTFKVKAGKRFPGNRSGRTSGCFLSFICPKCGQQNSHGGKWGKKGLSDGHRVSHCPCWEETGYYIKEV